jgi:hypothetical protein
MYDKPRKQRLTYHMLGILQILQSGPTSPRGMIYSALVCLAMHGYVKVGRKASLTPTGVELMQGGRLVLIGAYL